MHRLTGNGPKRLFNMLKDTLEKGRYFFNDEVLGTFIQFGRSKDLLGENAIGDRFIRYALYFPTV